MKSLRGLATSIQASTALVGLGDAEGNEHGGPTYARQPVTLHAMPDTREDVTILANDVQIMFPPADTDRSVATAILFRSDGFELLKLDVTNPRDIERGDRFGFEAEGLRVHMAVL